MQAWKGWPLERLMYLFFGVAFFVVWAQIYLFHGVAGNFREGEMFIPVYFTPLLAASAFWYAISRSAPARTTFLALFSFGVLTGGMGMYHHFNGVAGLPGGLILENFAAGPPVLLPLTYTALCLLALGVALWPVKLTAPDFQEQYEQHQTVRKYRGRTPA